MNLEELKVLLLNTIAKVRANLEVIESCKDEVEDLVPMEHAKLVRLWLDAIEQDVQNGNIPEFQIRKSIEDLNATKLHLFSNTREGIIAEIRRFKNDRSRAEMIPAFNMVRHASSHYYVYQVLHSIGFAQRNTVIVGPNGSGKTTLANCFTSTIRQSTGIVIPAQKLLFIPHIIGIPLPEEVDRAYDRYQSNPRDTKRTYEYHNNNDFPANVNFRITA